MTGTASPKVLVIGLDCAEPSLVFDQWRDELPNLSRLAGSGVWGELESCMPAITVPAWMTMMTSRQPGELGIYGFRNRADYSYDRMTMVNSKHVALDTVWDILSRQGKQCIVIGVPPTYPLKPINGAAISCFLTPSAKSQFTYPNELRTEVEALVGEYMVDVSNFRTEDKDWLLGQIYLMTEKRFKVANHWLRTKPWDFFMLMEIGVDRIHHAFWKYMDPLHPKHVPGNKYVNAIRDYYRFVDARIGEMLETLDDATTVLVVSDHGAKRMDGGIVFNEWLRREGYLVLKDDPIEVTPFAKVEVDWTKTRAWGEGGYYGRLFMNVQGRESQGVIPPARYEAERDELVTRLAGITDDKGKNIGTTAYKPQSVYRTVRNVPPDLIVYFGDLYWRSIGSLGYQSIHTFDNDSGPDDANHAQFGMFILKEPSAGHSRRAQGAQIYDVAPTILNSMGFAVPGDMIGRDLRER
jgi:predicted AlkP superfamily phosphohydrolase/phosphomutase